MKYLMFTGIQRGFTLIETILYISIVAIMLTTLIPFTWNILEGQSKSATQEEISSNARLVSMRIQREIRNSYGISSPNPGQSASTLVLCENSGCSTTTTFSLSSGKVYVNPSGTGSVQITSNDVNVTNLLFTNNSSSITENASFSVTVKQAYTGTRNEFIGSTTASSSAEVRNF